MSDAMPDDEQPLALIQQEAWLKALDWLHAAWRDLDGDARARRAAEVFDEAFLADLDARSPEALEQCLMLHHGRMRALPEAKRARLADVLATRSEAAGDAETPRSQRRRAFENGRAGARAPANDDGQRRETEAGGVRITRVDPKPGAPEGRASLFKSRQERAFFEALRAAFPTHLVYPNAALSAALDFERLAQAERDYFFRPLVDAVVVDPHDRLRPVFFFEMDSAHHDAAEVRRRDRRKDALLTKAGRTLYRLRRTNAEAGRAALEKAIRTAVRGS